MFTRIAVPESLTSLAAEQGGVISAQQAQDSGVTRAAIRRLHRNGHWHRIAPGIWSARAEPPWLGLAWAGILQTVDGVLGGRAAGHLHGVCAEPTVIEVWSLVRRSVPDPRWRFRRGLQQGRGSPPRVRLETAVLQMCQEETAEGIVTVLARAVGTRRTTVERLRHATLGAPTLRNRKLVLDILHDVADGIESPLERLYLKTVERAHGLPAAHRQITITEGTRSDVGYPDFGLLVELDGQLWHEGPAAWADMERDNRHQLLSLTTLRFGWHAVLHDPCGVAQQIAEALHSGGWRSGAKRCSRCR